MKKITLVGPLSPTGSSWLANCFLELGIKVASPIFEENYKQPMWLKRGDSHYLHPYAFHVKALEPSISQHQNRFAFRTDVEVDYDHLWYRKGAAYLDNPTVLFVRDPRDSLYSNYKRFGYHSRDLSFYEYLNLLDPNTLLTQLDTYILYVICWLQHPHCKVVRFESYREDPKRTLQDILAFLQMDVTESELERALAASTPEKTREAEAQLRQNLMRETFDLADLDANLLFDRFGATDMTSLSPLEFFPFAAAQAEYVEDIRYGKSYNSKNAFAGRKEEDRAAYELIDRKARNLMLVLGYPVDPSVQPLPLNYGNVRLIPHLADVQVPAFLNGPVSDALTNTVHAGIMSLFSILQGQELGRWYRKYPQFQLLYHQVVAYFTWLGLDQNYVQSFTHLSQNAANASYGRGV